LSREIVALLDASFSLTEREREVLHSTLRELDRPARRFYFGCLRPREKEFKALLREGYAALDGKERQSWLDVTVASMMRNRGEPDLADRLVMDALGRISVYGAMRKKAEEQGVVLRAMTSFGGTVMILYLFLFLALAIVLLRYYLH
jgi:hypothetical protein